MKMFRQERSVRAAGVPVASHGAPPARDRRAWLIPFPVALIVVCGSLWTHSLIRGRNPKSVANNNLGNVLFKQGKYEDAAIHFSEALRLSPDFDEAHNNLGNVFYKQGKYGDAMDHFTEALRVNPGYADAHNNFGTVLSRRGRYPEAEAHFVEAIRLRPDNAQAHYNLGLVFSQLRDYQRAQAQFAEAIRLRPDDPKAYNASAMVWAACPDANYRDGNEAVRLATRACELTKWQNPIILDTLAAAQAEARDFEAAVKSQIRAIELLTEQGLKNDFRSRLALYHAKTPYRQVSSQPAASEARP